MSRVDAHAHIIPEGYLSELRKQEQYASLPMPAATPELLLEHMERYDLAASVVSLSPPGVWFGDAGLAREQARLVNEEIAALVHAQPTRFAGLATLPLPDVDGAVAELDHALDRLGLDGVALFSNVDGMYLGNPAWDPLFAELDRRGAYVFVHPMMPPTPSPQSHVPAFVAEFPFDTTRAVIELIYSGTLERYPNVRLQLAHLGGAAPFLAHRIGEWAERDPDRAAAAPAGAVTYLRRLFYDTGLANNSVALAAVRELAGLERVVFGTDWPYGVLAEGVDPAPGLGLSGSERDMVDFGNVTALVPRWRS